MPYQRLARRLAEAPSPAVSTLPDGSVDRFCRLSAGALDPVERRTTFAREAAAGRRKGFGLEPERVEPGGQSVNTAQQAHALGADATCYGHLDDPEPGRDVFDALPLETVSMGRPAIVNILDFEDNDLLLVEASPDLADWRLADLRAAAPLPEVFDTEAVACSNWVSVPGMAEAFHELGDASIPRVPFVFDPGDVLGGDAAAHRELREAIRALGASVDVVLSVNPTELRALAAALPEPPESPDDEKRVRAIRQAADAAAVVKHGKNEALAATREGIVRVDNPVVEDRRQIGGGDRFAGGLAVGLGDGWNWETALAAGNACASHYVATGETASATTLREWLLDRDLA
ncbi:carbohydrate kinase family protein [Halolamina salifodinae]|uniref:Sugar/nucleoside kinase (Ribokinase family) n=1 Tax=Halolamina salifodinae TaxID=1202767 RepID=A0A8T4GTA7_9EURY|nr:PfkB family carbohydrate kinase [Halolamina salifodinae]MBP1986119.1 sugar/nucleoside kinase (ribokinase family) [Halolamina salifodinae]